MVRHAHWLAKENEWVEEWILQVFAGGCQEALCDDPYLPENDVHFTSEMRNWPNLEFGHIFTYFVSRPGLFTQEELMSWKQLEAYNYFKSGHVRTVFCRVFGRGGMKFVLLKAMVNPSQKSPDKAHSVWVVTKPDGTIICGHCTCMAGWVFKSYIDAILFAYKS